MGLSDTRERNWNAKENQIMDLPCRPQSMTDTWNEVNYTLEVGQGLSLLIITEL